MIPGASATPAARVMIPRGRTTAGDAVDDRAPEACSRRGARGMPGARRLHVRPVKAAGTRRADGRHTLPAPAMLAVLAAVHLALNFALTPNTPFPFSPGDFAFLGMGLQDLGWDWKRPVSANIIFVV